MIENRLLLRQLRKHLPPGSHMPPELDALLHAVQATYEQADNDRKLVERSMELSSAELYTANETLRQQNERNLEVLRRLRLLATSLTDQGDTTPAATEGNDALALSGVIEGLVARRNEAESRLRTALDEANAANRAKSDFLATMSHEIRTPMNGVIGFTELLLESELTPEQRRFVNTMRQSGETLLALINDILDLSKIEAGRLEFELQPTPVTEVAADVAALLNPRALAKGLRLDLAVSCDHHALVMADPIRLRQVLLNLAGNAVKFTERGRVLVQICPTSPASDPGTGTSVTLPAGHILISVVDTGPGIPQDVQSRLFQKFTQADSSTTRKFGGTGLGLAIAKRLVEMMGGTIGLQSKPGAGSNFWFTLPLTTCAAAPKPADAKPEPVAIAPASPGASRGPHVLVAEDNEVNQMVTAEILRRLGCTAEFVGTGREVLERLPQHHFDLVLMDCRMPELDGFGATRLLREREGSGRRIPVVALTANAINGDRERCLAAGMDDYVTKPVTVADLGRAITRWTTAPQHIGA